MIEEKKIALVLLKPEATHRGIMGKIMTILEENAIKIIGIKLLVLSNEQAEKIYDNCKYEKFYHDLVSYMISGPCLAIALEGKQNFVDHISELCGRIGQWGTIRGRFASHYLHNVIHCSEDVDETKKQVYLIFKKEELVEYNHALESWF